MKSLFFLLLFLTSISRLESQTTFQKLTGGSGNDKLYSIIEYPQGFFTLLGYTESMGHANGDVYMMRINQNGDTLWTRAIGTVGGDEEGYFFQHTSDGGYI
ncbi:MAG TPA: hypothetical protein VFJ43_13305, partial [Bacteroidia bacterium]|nr:hypothetical protein [Bacteroidia bacterium]